MTANIKIMGRFRVKENWDCCGREGNFFGYVYTNRKWAVIVFDDEDEPTFHKIDGLQIAVTTWTDL